MIEMMHTPSDAVLEFNLSGKVTGADYDTVLTPAIETALKHHDKIRILARFGPDFEGYSLEAAWDDTRLGLKHWSGFERAAVVSDTGWVRMATRAIGFAMPCPVKVFGLDELEAARLWLREGA